MTNDEKKRRQAIVEQEKKVISEMNDLTELKKRVQQDRKKHDEQVMQNEVPLQKIANPPADKSL